MITPECPETASGKTCGGLSVQGRLKVVRTTVRSERCRALNLNGPTATRGNAHQRCIVDADLNDTGQRSWERQCVQRTLAGEAAAFGELYDAYAERLYARVLFPLLGNSAAAQDALGETFRVAFQNLKAFQVGQVSIYFWLARIAKNKALDMHRARKSSGRALANFETLLQPLYQDVDSPADLLEREFSRQELGQAVQEALAELNARYRQAIELRFLQDQPREVCAERLGVKLGTFDVLLLRALRAFRKTWEELLAARVSVP
jgi:RNA polymerase sigma factor (sigma-70 family)